MSGCALNASPLGSARKRVRRRQSLALRVCPRIHLAARPTDNTRAVFLDRDGVVVDDPGYLADPDLLRLLPGAAEAIAHLRAGGWRVVLVTNQSGVARGALTEARLGQVHERLTAVLAERGSALDAIYYCPHLGNAPVPEYALDCDCRKPAPGMLLAAAADLNLNLAECWMVGDQPSDIAAGQSAGCRTVLIASAAAPPAPDSMTPTLTASCLLAAVNSQLLPGVRRG